MLNLLNRLLGPLTGPECRRASSRGWLTLVRVLAALVSLGVGTMAIWAWWFGHGIDPYHRPFYELRIALVVIEGAMLALSLVLGPALMAGSLAGDKERGTLALLLTTRVDAREIVTGRIIGKLSQLAMIQLAGVPALVGIAALGGASAARIGLYLLFPAAVGAGAVGLSALASVVSRRGRDALLAVYLVEFGLMLCPLVVGSGLVSPTYYVLLAAPNPFAGWDVFGEGIGLIWPHIAFWLVVGAVSIWGAARRLRPSCLEPMDGERVGRRRGHRGIVPPVDPVRPVLWKELFIERVGTLGKFGRWGGILLVFGLIGGSVGLTALSVFGSGTIGQAEVADWARDQLRNWFGRTGWLISCLITWAIGLRAAVSISSERERGTWDALMTSPLEGGEIVVGKLWGSFYALRWLALAAFLAWTLTAASGAVPVGDAVCWGFEVLVVGGFMSAVGVRSSLACQTATRAMSLTIGIWLGAYVAVSVVSAFLLIAGFLVCNAAWIALSQIGVVPPPTTVWFPLPAYYAWPLIRFTTYLMATFLMVVDTRLRFDRLAGRVTGGTIAVAFDDLLYGRPEAPVLLEEENSDELGLESVPEASTPPA